MPRYRVMVCRFAAIWPYCEPLATHRRRWVARLHAALHQILLPWHETVIEEVE